MVIGEVTVFERHQSAKKLKNSSAPIYDADFQKYAAASQPEYCQVSIAQVDRVVEFLQSRVQHMGVLLDSALGVKQNSLAI